MAEQTVIVFEEKYDSTDQEILKGFLGNELGKYVPFFEENSSEYPNLSKIRGHIMADMVDPIGNLHARKTLEKGLNGRLSRLLVGSFCNPELGEDIEARDSYIKITTSLEKLIKITEKQYDMICESAKSISDTPTEKLEDQSFRNNVYRQMYEIRENMEQELEQHAQSLQNFFESYANHNTLVQKRTPDTVFSMFTEIEIEMFIKEVKRQNVILTDRVWGI